MKQIASVLGLLLLLAAALAVTSAFDIRGIIHELPDVHRHRAGYRFNYQGQTATTHDEGVIATDVRHIAVDNRYGNVKIAVADDGPQWSWDLKCWASTTEDAQRLAEQIRMAVHAEGHRMAWTVELPDPPAPELRGVQSNLTVMVPAEVEVELTNEFGETEIRGVQGGTSAQCRHGRLQLEDLGTAVLAEASHTELHAQRIAPARLTNQHGTIEVTGVDGDLEATTSFAPAVVRDVAGELTVENEHGKVVASQVSGAAYVYASFGGVELEEIEKDVRVRNRHGHVIVRAVEGNVDCRTEHANLEVDAACEEVRCQNKHGRIRLHLTSPKLRLVDAATFFGDLSVELLPTLSPRIKARARRGEVESDFPLHETGANSGTAQAPEAITTRIMLENLHGDIHVRKLPEVAASE